MISATATFFYPWQPDGAKNVQYVDTLWFKLFKLKAQPKV